MAKNWYRRDPAKFRRTIIAKSAIKSFLERERDDFTWIKNVSKPDLQEYVYDRWNAFHTEPWNHQLASFAIGMEQPQFIFNLFMGGGKTKLVADLIRFHKLRSGLKKVLVTVPNLINIETWANQLDRHAPDLTYERLEGDKDTRFDLISQRADIYLINYAGLPVYMTEISHEKDSKGKSLGRVVNPQAKKDFAAIFQGGGLIMDELHNMGNSSSLTHRLLKSLSNKIEFRYGLTGTLFGRDPTIMQPQFSLIDSGYSLGETLALFRSAFCTEQAHPFKGVEYIFDESKADLLHGYIQHRSLRYEDYECTDMPKRIPIVEQLGWGDEQLLFYKRVLEDYKGIKLNKNLYINLRQIVSGFVGYEDEEGAKAKIIFDDNPKADRLVQLVDEMPLDAKLVVVNQYIVTGQIIRDALDKAKVKYAQIWGKVKNPAAEFRKFIADPKCRVLQANYRSIGTGTDGLQDVANYLVFFESPPDPITREQTERRIYRPGQKKRAFIYDLTLRNEIIANRILKYLAEGKDLQKAVNEGGVIFDRRIKL